MRQLTIFDWMPEEPEIGAYVTKTGATIPHIMRPGYIGHKVLFSCSTQSRTLYRCGILENYIPYEGVTRSIIYTGAKQRTLLTHYEGINIYECLSWDKYPERMKALGRRSKPHERTI